MIEILNKYIFGPSLPIVILCIGSFLFVKYGSFTFTKPYVVLKALMQKDSKKGMSPLRSAMLALAGTLGVGNIVGVSTAIFLGGQGAVFWLTVSAFAAMPLKYGEVVLAVRYREKNLGEYRGGAMYYMHELSGKRYLSVLFALLCIVNSLTVGNIVQINSVCESFETVYGIPPVVIGIICSLIVYFSAGKGSYGMSNVTSSLVPVASVVYILFSLYVICINISSIPSVLKGVLESAFNFRSAFGGVGGYTVMKAMRFGVARGIMSNEAGSGTSPIAHAKTSLDTPAEQGFWGVFEVFADTVIMCNLTALVILLSFEELVVGQQLSGMELVIAAYSRYAGRSAGAVIVFSVLLFALATVISQCFYGLECVEYLTKDKRFGRLYVILFAVLAIFGCFIKSELMWETTDLNLSLMTIINTCFVLYASGEIKQHTQEYFKRLSIK